MGISALISSNKPSCMTGTEVPVLARGINISQGYYSWLKDTTWTWKSPGKEGSASESETGDNSNSNPFANAYNDLHEPSGQLETTITHWICPLPSTASITKYLLIACYFIRKWTSPLLQHLIFETEIKNIHILNWAKVFLMFMVFRSDQSCPTLCDPMNRSTPGLPIHHCLGWTEKTLKKWTPKLSKKAKGEHLNLYSVIRNVSGDALAVQWLRLCLLVESCGFHPWSGNWDPDQKTKT